MKIKLKDGNTLIGSGEGLMTAEDYDDEEYQFDTFSVGVNGNSIVLNIESVRFFL